MNGTILRITETITVDAPIERVWAVTVDLDALPSTTPTISSIERLDGGPVEVGTRARLSQPGLPRRVWTVETLDAPYRFAWATRLLGVRMVGVHDLAPAGHDRTELTLGVELEGRGAATFGRFARRSIARSLGLEAEGFSRAAAATAA